MDGIFYVLRTGCRYRRILVRWEKKAANYEALLHLVFAHILWRNS